MAKENRKRVSLNRFNYKVDDQLPTYRFIAYLGWGSTPHIVEELAAAGVEVRATTIDMEPAFDDIGVLIMPSLWFEAWGIVVTEAQLRGIPVIASDVGGIPEAKRYTLPMISVNAIDGSVRKEDGTYVIPEQDITPWMKALDEIMGTQERYDAAADASFFTVRNWCRKFDTRAMEKFLLAMMK